MNKLNSTIITNAAVAITFSAVVGSFADIVIYGVDDVKSRDSRMFELNIDSGYFQWLSPVYEDLDIEGMAALNNQIYAITGDKGKHHDLITLDYLNGSYSVISSMDFGNGPNTEVVGMATHTDSGTMWGYLEKRGFATFDGLGNWDLQISYSKSIEGLAVANDGLTLYGIAGAKIYAADVLTGEVDDIVNLGGRLSNSHIENLEMWDDGRLAGFTHADNDTEFFLYDIANDELETYSFDNLPATDIGTFLFATAIPEPASLLLASCGAWAICGRKRKRSISSLP